MADARRRPAREAVWHFVRHIVRRCAVAACAAACAPWLAGCPAVDPVRVRLEARPALRSDPLQMEVRAQVAGPLHGLRYRWYSVLGECTPQETTTPATQFHFADGVRRDRVSVVVWRDSTRVAEADVSVALDDRFVTLWAAPALPAAAVEITTVPPFDAIGGPETRAEIAGRVTGEVPAGYDVVIYAQADVWYIQPQPNVAIQVGPDRRWRTWTHTGARYAALLVRHGFAAMPRVDVLPPAGADVAARAIVDGVRP